jgi:hypothetical protein
MTLWPDNGNRAGGAETKTGRQFSPKAFEPKVALPILAWLRDAREWSVSNVGQVGNLRADWQSAQNRAG